MLSPQPTIVHRKQTVNEFSCRLDIFFSIQPLYNVVKQITDVLGNFVVGIRHRTEQEENCNETAGQSCNCRRIH